MNSERKIVLLAGGSTGYLKLWAMLLAGQGTKIFVAVPHAQQLDGIDAVATVIYCNFTNLADLDRVYEEVCAGGELIDVLLVGSDESTGAPEPAEKSGVDLIFNRKTRGVFFTVQKGIRYLAKGAMLGVAVPDANDTHVYGVDAKTRAAIRSFVTTWRQELPRGDIDVRELTHGKFDFL